MFRLLLLLLIVASVPGFGAEETTDNPTGASRETSSQVLAAESPLQFGLDIFYSPRAFPNHRFSTGVQTSDAGGAIQIAFEWMPMTRYGKLGVGIAAGAAVLPRVVLVDDTTDITGALYSFPVGGFLSYRLDYFTNQILVPYGRVGAGIEFARQGSQIAGYSSATYGFPWLETSIGGELLLDFIETSTAHRIDRKWGINNTYLFFEYAMISALSSGSSVNLARNEMRFGLRLEM